MDQIPAQLECLAEQICVVVCEWLGTALVILQLVLPDSAALGEVLQKRFLEERVPAVLLAFGLEVLAPANNADEHFDH